MSRAAPAGARAGVPPEEILRKIRIPFVQRARVAHGAQGLDVFLVDLGLLGVFAEMEVALPAGEVVEVRFLLPGNEVPIVARCRVAWRHESGEPPRGLPVGVGLAFVDVSAPENDRIREYVTEHCRGTPQARRFSRHWPGADEGESA